MRRVVHVPGLVLVCAGLAGLMAGCEKRAPTNQSGGTPTKTGPDEAPKPASPPGGGLTQAARYEVVPADPAQVGTLEILAVYTSEAIPPRSEVPVNINVEFCNHKVFTENVVVDPETRGLSNVVVRLENISRGSRKPDEKLTIFNRGCTFVPHVSVAMKGTLLEIKNDDPVFHTTHPYRNGRHWFNIPLQKKGDQGDTSRARPLNLAGTVEFNCDVHKWMKAYTVVHTNPYITVTEAQGRAVLDQIPPGDYPYIAWHEQLGEKQGTIKIEAGKPSTLKLEFALAQ